MYLAPMEGLVDFPMRELLTGVGGIDIGVTEFLRVTSQLLPDRVFYRISPELRAGAKTVAGTPVTLQLLGSDPEMLAENAQRAVALGAWAIDLNFGCPAKTVNRSQGGAILLKEPERVARIVRCVREALPEGIPLSAKMRLGYEDKLLALDNAQAIADSGAQLLCVHARTKVEGYRPPAHWAWIRRIDEAISIPVVANGEIWSLEDYCRCREVSGCDRIMIGRGLVSRPDLALQIRAHHRDEAYTLKPWIEILPLVNRYFQSVVLRLDAKYAPGRVKQWLKMLARNYPEARQLFDQLRRETAISDIQATLDQALTFYTANTAGRHRTGLPLSA